MTGAVASCHRHGDEVETIVLAITAICRPLIALVAMMSRGSALI